jgi:hypothetical protein
MPALPTDILVIILIGVIVLLIGWIIRLEMRLSRIFRGKAGSDLEDVLRGVSEDVKQLHSFRRESMDYYKNVEARLRRSVQAVETVRFNPFKGTGSGGNQSFSSAFLAENGDGVVISSLYARDHVSVFAKPVKAGTSTFELTEEERQAISEARNHLNHA